MTCQLIVHVTQCSAFHALCYYCNHLSCRHRALVLAMYVASYMILDFMETDLHKIIYSKNELTDEHIQYFVYQILKGTTQQTTLLSMLDAAARLIRTSWAAFACHTFRGFRPYDDVEIISASSCLECTAKRRRPVVHPL